MLNDSTFQINTSDTVKCISSSEDGAKIAFGDNSGKIHLANNKGDIIWDKSKPDGAPRKLMDSTKLFSLGWQPKFDLQSGLIEAYGWYLNNFKSI